jgi:Protein of unknown function (DUF3306)
MTKDLENTSESFLSRWAKRKADVRAEEVKSVDTQNTNPSTSVPFEAKMPETAMPERGSPSNSNETTETNPPLPTIESLTQESDFSPFMGKDVAADLRNQAMKKLFTNPHYNVQDGLDIYIGDYTKSDPIPLEMLRKMTQSKALFLFEEEEKAEAEAAALAAADSDNSNNGDEAITNAPLIEAAEPLIETEPAPEKEAATHAHSPSTDVTDASIKSK